MTQPASARSSKLAAASGGRAGATRARVETGSRLAFLLARQQHADRRAVHRDRADLLRAGRRARVDHAHAAGGAGQHAGQPAALQPAVHDARHRDDVSVRDSGGRSDSRLHAAQHARCARYAVSTAWRVRVLGVRVRWHRIFHDDFLRRRARWRLVHVSAADESSIRPGSAPTGICWESDSSKSLRLRERSS